MELKEKLQIAESILTQHDLMSQYTRTVRSIAQKAAYKEAYELHKPIHNAKISGHYTNAEGQRSIKTGYLTGYRNKKNHMIVKFTENLTNTNIISLDMKKFDGVILGSRNWDVKFGEVSLLVSNPLQ